MLNVSRGKKVRAPGRETGLRCCIERLGAFLHRAFDGAQAFDRGARICDASAALRGVRVDNTFFEACGVEEIIK